MGQATTDPLGGTDEAAHWGWVYDYDDDAGGGFASGEMLLRRDGKLLRRYVRSRYRDGQTTYQAGPWQPVPWWEGLSDPDKALRALKAHGYSLCQPNVPIDRDEAGPFPGLPPLAEYL